MGPPHASGVLDEAPGLCVLEKAGVEARRDRIRLDHDRLERVRDDDPEDASEEEAGLLEALDDRVQGLVEGEPGVPRPAVASLRS